MIVIEPERKYTRKEIMAFLEYNKEQLTDAENRKFIVFTGEYMYGVYFFQFLKNNCKQLEIIHDKPI